MVCTQYGMQLQQDLLLCVTGTGKTSTLVEAATQVRLLLLLLPAA
jgi:hypothetical protein